MGTRATTLNQARRDAGLSFDELWMRYFALGGMASRQEMHDYVVGAADVPRFDHDMIAVALNEEFVDQGRECPVTYLKP